jgi:hypothetical protein
VAANAGNPIFLAAYLITAFFLTLERVFTSFVRLLGVGHKVAGPLQDLAIFPGWRRLPLRAAVQSIALVWTQSRGPWLGWIPGIFLFVLLAVSTVRPRYFATLLSLASAGTVGLVPPASWLPTLFRPSSFCSRLRTLDALSMSLKQKAAPAKYAS